jgi:transposase
MEQYVGLDVSMAKTAVCVIDEQGQRLWQGSCGSTPDAIQAVLHSHAPLAVRIGLETGPLAVWHWYALRDAGFPVVCLHARHAKAALELQLNKTDPNDAFGLAQIVRTGWFRPVELKSMASYRLRLVLSARQRLVGMRTSLYNQIRGRMKTFGIVLAPGKGGKFHQLVEDALPADPAVRLILETQLALWATVGRLIRSYDRLLQQAVRRDAVCQRLLTVPGVGVLTAVAFRVTIDDPTRFQAAADVAAYLGLTPQRYQSGDVDRVGHITKSGDALMRTLLYEAGHQILTRTRHPSALQRWGRELARRVGHRKACVAMARKLAIVLFCVWRDATDFVAEPRAA